MESASDDGEAAAAPPPRARVGASAPRPRAGAPLSAAGSGEAIRKRGALAALADASDSDGDATACAPGSLFRTAAPPPPAPRRAAREGFGGVQARGGGTLPPLPIDSDEPLGAGFAPRAVARRGRGGRGRGGFGGRTGLDDDSDGGDRTAVGRGRGRGRRGGRGGRGHHGGPHSSLSARAPLLAALGSTLAFDDGPDPLLAPARSLARSPPSRRRAADLPRARRPTPPAAAPGSGRSGGLVLAMAAAVGGVATAVDGPPPVPLFVVAG
jgi:hypothetical protein